MDISHFVFLGAIFGSVLVHLDRKRPISGRSFSVMQALITGMLASCRLVRGLSGWALS